MTLGPTGEVHGGEKFFEKLPFRSAFFVVDTMLLVLLCYKM